jgi:hypothetical protein
MESVENLICPSLATANVDSDGDNDPLLGLESIVI